MSNKLNANELAYDRRVGLLWTRDMERAYAAAIREVAQPIADERDELLDALALIANALSPNSLPVNGMMASYDHALMVREEADRAFEIARAAIAKYPKP